MWVERENTGTCTFLLPTHKADTVVDRAGFSRSWSSLWGSFPDPEWRTWWETYGSIRIQSISQLVGPQEELSGSFYSWVLTSCQGLVFLPVVQSLGHIWLCDPMDCSLPSLPAAYNLPEFAQVHVHWIDDAIQPSPLVSCVNSSEWLARAHDGLWSERWALPAGTLSPRASPKSLPCTSGEICAVSLRL